MKRLLLLFAAILMASTGMWAADNVAYIDATGALQYKDGVTEITNSTTTLSGWCVVNSTVTTGTLTCSGEVHLILADGAKLTATGAIYKAGIQVSGEDNSLTVYGQTAQTGQLIANGGEKAAGIGGGEFGSGSNIIINGGMVTANGRSAIGGGYQGDGYNITINGGTVTANGDSGAGIGGGSRAVGSNITINGGMITATSSIGSGIGNGGMASTSASNIKVATKCIVKSIGEISTDEIATGRSDETDIADDLAGKKYVTIETAPVCVTYIDENGKAQEVVATEVWGSFDPVTWGVPWDGYHIPQTTWYIVNGVVVLPAGAICQGDVRLILADGAKLTATGWFDGDEWIGCAGIQVSGGNSLTIYGQANQSGQLIANGGQNTAGIGGGRKGNGTNITINGGTVTANGGNLAAGIGGGSEAAGTNITINGGTVTANGGYSAAGIGGGYWAVASNITINDGTVIATGGDGASGIGGGYNGSCNNIFVATTLGVKAGSDNPPITEINNDGDDLDRKLNGKRYATITSLQPIKDAAINAIDAAFEGVTNENVKYFATTAKTSIEAATSEKAINSIKEKALTDLQNALAIYEVGKTAGFGTLSEKQNGPALIVTDKDDKEIILYSPKSVEYIKVNEK